MTSRLSRLLRPRSIAFVGGRSLAVAIRNAQELGYDGDLHVVNPSLDEVAGVPAVPSVADLPSPPDAAFVGVRRELAVEVVRALAERGAGGCVCMSAGFAEVDAVGARLQAALVEAAGPELPLIGPNCYGLLNYLDGVALWPDLHGGRRVERGVAVVAQSGNISLNATMASRSVPIGVVVSAGNQAVLTVADHLDALLEDDRIDAIGCYIEGVPDELALADSVARARDRGVPVLGIAAGASETGARLAATHTGSRGTVARPELLTSLGMPVVDGLPELLESLKLLTAWRTAGRSLVAVGASGGDLSLFAAQAERAGFSFPRLADEVQVALGAQLGPLATTGNPLDTNTAIWGDRDALEACFTTLMGSEADAVVLLLDVPLARAGDLAAWDDAVEAFIAAHARTGRPAAVVSSLPEGLPWAHRERLLAGGVAPLQGMREAVVAMDVAALWRPVVDRPLTREG